VRRYREEFSPDRGPAPDAARFALALLVLPVAAVVVLWEWWREWRMLPRTYRVIGRKED
jgi:hypothetical protein